MLLALLQANAAVLDVEANCARHWSGCPDAAAAAGAAVLVTPELFPVGYAPRRVRAELDPAGAAGHPGALAGDRPPARHRPGLQPAAGHRTQGDWQITSTLVDARGRSCSATPRCTCSAPTSGRRSAPPRHGPAVVDFHGIRTSMVICYDVEFPEAVRAAAAGRGGAAPGPHRAGARLRRRSPGAAARPGTGEPADHRLRQPLRRPRTACEFLGGSVIAGPDGSLLAAAGPGAEILYAEVDPEPPPGSAVTGAVPRERRPGASTGPGASEASGAAVHVLQRNPQFGPHLGLAKVHVQQFRQGIDLAAHAVPVQAQGLGRGVPACRSRPARTAGP